MPTLKSMAQESLGGDDMKYPPDYPGNLTSADWDITFEWKKKRLRYLLDMHIDELLDTNFGREAAIVDRHKKERAALAQIKPLHAAATSKEYALERITEIYKQNGWL